MSRKDPKCWCGAESAEGWMDRDPGWPLCAEHTEPQAPDDDPGTIDVFVYGTLKQAYGNFQLVSDLCEAVRVATVEDFLLLELGAFPGAVPGKGHKVRGEVLTLNRPNEALKRLDQLEGVPRLYTREAVAVYFEDGTDQSAWMYVLAKGSGRSWHQGPVALDNTGAADWHPKQRDDARWWER